MIFFFYGPNSYASRDQVRKMTEAYLAKTGSDLSLERIDGSAVDLKKLVASVQAVPFMASSRLVIVQYLSQNKTVAEKVDDVMKLVPTTTVAVFYEKDVDKRSRYYKTLSSQAKAVEFKLLSPAQLSSWVKAEVKRLGGTIDAAAASELINRCGDDQWRLSGELAKLVNYNQNITKAAVEELVTERIEENIFGLVEAMTDHKVGLALERYRGLLAGGANELYVLTMVMWQLRNLLLAQTAGAISPAQLSKEAGLSPYVAQKALGMKARFSETELKEAFIAGIETEAKIKTGEGKPDQLVELLIYDIASK